MKRRIYGWLIRMLPPRQRAQFGDDMVEVFGRLHEREQRDRGDVAAFMFWMQEVGGVLRFIIRQWASAMRAALPSGGPGVATELRWVWQGIRSRGYGAPLVVLLLAGTIGATATTFAVADALVFNPHPFPDSHRIVTVEQFVEPKRRPDRNTVATLHDEWRKQRDVFSAVGSYLEKGGVFLQDPGSSEQIGTADITVDFLNVLGVAPAWGRTFSEADLDSTEVYAALVSEGFAARRFGSANAALGQRMQATGRPLVIVGVMDEDFAFPSARTDLWRLMDLRGPLTANFGGAPLMGRGSPDRPASALNEITEARSASVGSAVGLPHYQANTRPHFEPSPERAAAMRDGQQLLLLLLGAGVSLLLISCANVASLEIAHVIRRTRVYAIRAALGASRPLLARMAALEGAVIVGVGLVASVGVAVILLDLAAPYFPASFARVSHNRIDVDFRVVGFCVAAAMLASLLVSVPAMLLVRNPGALSLTARVKPSNRSWLRQGLTVVQVALAVALVIVGAMFSRSYSELLALDKGFDSQSVAVVSVAMPTNYFKTPTDRETATTSLLEEVRQMPGVLAASRATPPPSVGDSPMRTPLWIDNREVAGSILFGQHWVDIEYFDVTKLQLLAGRHLRPGDAATNIVIPEYFARRFWPDGNAVGGSVRGGEQTWFRDTMTVVGVVRDFRRSATSLPGPSDSLFSYHLRQPPPPFSAGTVTETQTSADSGGSYAFLTVSVRVASPEALPSVERAVQALDPRLAVTSTLVDDNYARLNAHILLASGSIGVFGLVSFAIAIAGLYGVIAFIVAAGKREIGIRIALGATAQHIGRYVLATSGRMAAVGTAAGIAIAFAGSRWIESQLFGVSPTDPTTYVLVAGAIFATALFACWGPARRAISTNPATTLRAE